MEKNRLNIEITDNEDGTVNLHVGGSHSGILGRVAASLSQKIYDRNETVRRLNAIRGT